MIDYSQAFLSPAKLNLFLHITGQREDGYHELQTIFQFISLSDKLYFSSREDSKINRLTNLDFPAEHDLIVKAAVLLQSHTGISKGVDIRIEKKIPIGGGLGGGSSNAATALLVLNELWQCKLPMTELAELGLALGADVPVFIYGKAAWAEGLGEEIHAVNLAECWFLVLAPQIHVSTAEIFQHSGLTRNTHKIKIRPLDEELAWQQYHNDCELIVRQEYPLIDNALKELSEYASARLTGTGACVFAAFASKQEAEQVQNTIVQAGRLKNTHSFVVKSENQSQLHKQLGIT